MYSILWCNFSSNVNSYDGRNPGVIEHQNSSWPFGKGGGLSLVIRGTARNNTFEIYSPDFLDNQAEFGGSVYVEIVDQASENNITFHSAVGTYSRFTGGQSQMGGAMHSAMFFLLLFTENVFSYYPNQTGQLATPAIEFIPHRPIYLNNIHYGSDAWTIYSLKHYC